MLSVPSTIEMTKPGPGEMAVYERVLRPQFDSQHQCPVAPKWLPVTTGL